MGTVIIDTALQQGLLYAPAVFGVVISFRLLNFPDLTVDGSFTLGGAVSARLLSAGHAPLAALLWGAAAGALAGIATALLNRKLGISKILSGILVMLILYSLNLRVMDRANISLLGTTTLFSSFSSNNGLNGFLAIVDGVLLLLLCYGAITRAGLFLRATGDNEFMVQGQGVNTDWVCLAGLGLANALVALSGGLVAQAQGFADVSMGTGIIITTLAALIIGESFADLLQAIGRKLWGRATGVLPWPVFNEFFAALLGAFLYFLIVAICLQLGLAQTDLKLATGLMVIAGIALRFKRAASETYQRSKL